MDGSESEQAKKEYEELLVSVYHELKDKFDSYNYDKEWLPGFLKVFLYRNKSIHIYGKNVSLYLQSFIDEV